nr:4Fe-4S dicluster domain-containing protein [Clostridia bacterium]
GGTPLEIGAILSGCDPFTLDTACMSLMSLDGNVIMQTIAHENRLCPNDASELTILGDNLESLKVKDYVKPDTLRGKKFEHIPAFLQPRPSVDKSICVGCGECAANCPVKTIEIKKDKAGKKKAHIIKSRCIRCYCCQELCHFNAVKIKKNFIYKLIK